MRLQQYLIESEEELRDLFITLERDCAPFLKELRKGGYPQHLIHRGSSYNPSPIVKVKRRKDRLPKDTPK